MKRWFYGSGTEVLPNFCGGDTGFTVVVRKGCRNSAATTRVLRWWYGTAAEILQRRLGFYGGGKEVLSNFCGGDAGFYGGGTEVLPNSKDVDTVFTAVVKALSDFCGGGTKFDGGGEEALSDFSGGGTKFDGGGAEGLLDFCGGGTKFDGGGAEALSDFCGGGTKFDGGDAEALLNFCGGGTKIDGGGAEALPNFCDVDAGFTTVVRKRCWISAAAALSLTVVVRKRCRISVAAALSLTLVVQKRYRISVAAALSLTVVVRKRSRISAAATLSFTVVVRKRCRIFAAAALSLTVVGIDRAATLESDGMWFLRRWYENAAEFLRRRRGFYGGGAEAQSNFCGGDTKFDGGGAEALSDFCGGDTKFDGGGAEALSDFCGGGTKFDVGGAEALSDFCCGGTKFGGGGVEALSDFCGGDTKFDGGGAKALSNFCGADTKFDGGSAEALSNFCGGDTKFDSGGVEGLSNFCGGGTKFDGGDVGALPNFYGGDTKFDGGGAEALSNFCGGGTKFDGGGAGALPNFCGRGTEFDGSSAEVLPKFFTTTIQDLQRWGMRRAIIMLNGLEIATSEAEPVIDIVWNQLRSRGPQVNIILESDGSDRVNTTIRLGTAGRKIIRDTVMKEVARGSAPQADPEAGEPEKVYGKPRKKEPTDKVTAAKKKFRYQIPILTMPEIDDTLSKLLGATVSVSFQTMLQASPRLLKGLRQLWIRWRVEIDENPESPEEEREKEAPQEVTNLQRSHEDFEELDKAFADIRLSLPNREGGEVKRAPPGTKLSFHALPVGKLKIQIGTHHTDALVDGGAEITLIRRDFATITGCTVNKEVTGSIRGAGGEIPFAGYVTKCVVKAGVRESIWSFQRMTVMEKMDYDIILGRPWCANVEMIGMHLHDGTYMVDIEDPVTGRRELLRLLGTGGNPPKGKLATWSPTFEDGAHKGAFARMEGMRERVEIMIEEAFNKKEWIKMGLPQKKRRQEDKVLGVVVAERESEVELGASLSRRKEVRKEVPEIALEIPDVLQLIKAIRYHKVGVDPTTLAKFEGEVQKGYCLNGKIVRLGRKHEKSKNGIGNGNDSRAINRPTKGGGAGPSRERRTAKRTLYIGYMSKHVVGRGTRKQVCRGPSPLGKGEGIYISSGSESEEEKADMAERAQASDEGGAARGEQHESWHGESEGIHDMCGGHEDKEGRTENPREERNGHDSCEGRYSDFEEGYERRAEIPYNLDPKNFTGEFSPILTEEEVMRRRKYKRS
ncbi:hypothetical protein CBR_g49863 [Chara braunii]|uniref:Peptidase A2 domain-containing protein n=1 Tax=Chara braunii TaxID=69332 RepID=A0A388JPB1_CHABU|nr:hypothetical protein CBR_g49863 [Chara braunii]|eukprot:GBG59598.1 hypothetical protein CBR_g49863 [Chara braunii]